MKSHNRTAKSHRAMRSLCIAVLALFTASHLFAQQHPSKIEEICTTRTAATSVSQTDTVINLKILLVEFTDVTCRKDSTGKTPRYSKADFENLLGSEGIYVSPAMHSPDGDEVFGSMNDFYEKMSGGKLHVNAQVINHTDPSSGRPIWVKLPASKPDYAVQPIWDTSIFDAASNAAWNAGLDPSVGAGTSLAIIYAGNVYFQSNGQMGGLNPRQSEHKYLMSELQGTPYTQENASAHFAQIGTHCHEFAHTLGIGHSSGSRADLMCSGTRNGSVPGNAPAPFNAIVRMRMGWAKVIPVDSVSGTPVDIAYSLTNPTVYTMKNVNGDMFIIENRRFDQTMTIGSSVAADYNNALFFPPAGPHGTIKEGIFIWRVSAFNAYPLEDPGYVTEGLIYASGSYGRTFPENQPSETDDGVPFPGVSGKKILSPWSDPRNPYMKEEDYFGSGGYHYGLFVPNTKGGSSCGMEILSENSSSGSFRVRFTTVDPPNPALAEQSTIDSLGANDRARTVCSDPSGRTHQVLSIGGEIFYRRSTDGGRSFQKTVVLSNPNGGNGMPSLTVAGTQVVATWQIQASGKDIYAIHTRRSFDAGGSWSELSSLGWSTDCPLPGPRPSVAGCADGTAFCLYRSGSSLLMSVSNTSGSFWSDPGAVSGTAVGADGWSSAVIYTNVSGPQENIAYATDGTSAHCQIRYNRYQIGSGVWGSEWNVSGIVPSRYSRFCNPSICAVPGADSLSILWDASDDYAGGNPVIISRSARPQDCAYRILEGQFQNGLSSDALKGELSAQTSGLECARVLNLTESATGAALGIEIGPVSLVHANGSLSSIPMSEPPSEGVALNTGMLMRSGESSAFALADDASSLQITVAVSGTDAQSLFSSEEGYVGFEIVGGSSPASFGKQFVPSIPKGGRRLFVLRVSVASLARERGPFSIRPVVSGLRTDLSLVGSIGHLYRARGAQARDTVRASLTEVMAQSPAPGKFALAQNYPNPFNPSTLIAYSVPVRSHVSLIVYNTIGQQVATLISTEQEGGSHEVRFDGSKLASGIYFYRLQAGENTLTKRLVILR